MINGFCQAADTENACLACGHDYECGDSGSCTETVDVHCNAATGKCIYSTDHPCEDCWIDDDCGDGRCDSNSINDCAINGWCIYGAPENSCHIC